MPAPILLLAQGHAGDRLGARLVPALRNRLPGRELLALGGWELQRAGARLLARTDRLSAMGYAGLLPLLPAAVAAMFRTARETEATPPALLIVVDMWQPLHVLHRFAPHLVTVPHLCYLPPAPNFIGPARVHGAVSRVFGAIVTPFPHQARLYAEAGGHVRLGAHAGLESGLEEATPLPEDQRENVLALLPGSRAMEVRYGLPVQAEAAEQVLRERPDLELLVCCASDEIEALVRRRLPGVRTERNARRALARARFGIITSGTAALEAAVFGCPGVVTYHGSPLQTWEWKRFHVAKLARLRELEIASPWISLPNILAGRELYPELLNATAAEVAAAALRQLGIDRAVLRAELDTVRESLGWEDAGTVVAEEAARLVETAGR